MIYTNLREIFPHSFIDYDGRRKAKVVLYGRHKVSEVSEKVDRHLNLGEHVSVNDLNYNGKYHITRFILQASGNTTPFLPRIDVADLECIKDTVKQEKEETVAQNNFSTKWDTFLNL